MSKLNAYQRFNILMSDIKAKKEINWREVIGVSECINNLLDELQASQKERNYFESAFHEENGLKTQLSIYNDILKEQIENPIKPVKWPRK